MTIYGIIVTRDMETKYQICFKFSSFVKKIPYMWSAKANCP